jgi:predicted ATPase/class 3 adenylate cyclase
MQALFRFGNVEVHADERRVLVDGTPVQLGGRAFDLLLALIARRDRVVAKDELVALCWPGLAVEENNLAVQISALRKLLGPQAIATVPGRGYRFTLTATDATAAPAPVGYAPPLGQPVTYLFTDVEGSSRLWEAHPQAMHRLMAQHDVLCRSLVAQHAGHIVKFTGDGIHAVFADPLDAVQTAVQLQLAVDGVAEQGVALALRIGLHRGLDSYRDGDFFGTAVNRAARIMSAAHGGQILVSDAVVSALGNSLPASLGLRDLGAVRLRDLSGSERLYQVQHAGLPAEFPPLRSLQATPNNLPQQVNAFIGRGQEQADVADLLANGRLVTLVAMGGIGKSRLAVQVGAALLDRFADGVWLVELAPVSEPAAVPLAVASALGLRESAGTLTDSLLQHLRDRELLLLLDNCEHLVQGCAQLVKTLLQGTRGVKVLATSRDPLAIAGETCYPLRPLPVPSRLGALPDALLRHDSVQLFMERAQAAQPSFRLTTDNAAAVAEICSRLDGIPLALELAAARIRVLTPQGIAARLDQRFKLLVAGDRTVLPRQKTLQALIEWSYDLLPPEEVLLLNRLAVFAGSWTLEAAEEVCGFGAIDQQDVLFLLANLVQKSLAMLDSESGRYRMLETVRAFAAERLDASDDGREARTRHFFACVRLAEEASPHLLGPEQRHWLERLDVEGENILAAHAWNCEHGLHAEQALAMGSAMRSYFIRRGLLNVGIRMLLDALGLPGVDTLGMQRVRALWSVADLMYGAGDLKQAHSHFTQCYALVQPMNDARRNANVLRSLCMCAAGLGDLEGARSYGEQAVAQAEAAGDELVLAAALGDLGLVLRALGGFAGSARLYRRALALVRQVQDDFAIATVLLNLSLLRLRQGRRRSAEVLLRTALERLADQQSNPDLVAAFDCAGALCVALQDWERATRFFSAAETRISRYGQRREPLDQLLLGVDLAALRGRGYVIRAGDGIADEEADLAALRQWLVERRGSAVAPRQAVVA